MRDEDEVLSFGDVVLRAGDVALLEGPHWLNDQIISFYFEHAELEEFKQLFSSGRVLLLPPAVTLLLANFGPGEAGSILEPLEVPVKDLVLFAVNDSSDTQTPGSGTHWTLLLYQRQPQAFRHYDSLPGGTSRAAAERLYRAVRSVLAPGGPCPLEHVQGMPRQVNGHDCGVYTLAVAHHILTAATATATATATAGSAGTDPSAPTRLQLDLEAMDEAMGSTLTPSAIQAFRRQLLESVRQMQQRQHGGEI